MKIRIRIKTPKKICFKNTFSFDSIKNWYINFKHKYPNRLYLTIITIIIDTLTIILRPHILNLLSQGDLKAQSSNSITDDIEKQSIEALISENYNENIQGISTSLNNEKIQSDVGFVDLRVLTLEDFFNHYGSSLAEYSDDFIEAADKYNVNNWQLIPAIAIAETNGCQTGLSYKQKNCWGWGGAGDNRWEFNSFDEAIDFITRSMINGYGNDRMNAKDIQNTYCGPSCAPYGWKWARGVNHYVIIINDFGEKYGLTRTNEIYNFNE